MKCLSAPMYNFYLKCKAKVNNGKVRLTKNTQEILGYTRSFKNTLQN